MTRPPRSFEAGLYHVTSHASDTRDLYLTTADREAFLRRLAETCRRFELGLVTYVEMGNHYHAVFRTPDERLSAALQHLHTSYSRHHNRVHGRSAHLFLAHCFARAIESDADLLTVARYVARNPVDAGFVDDPLGWVWGSARAHAGLEPPRIPLDEGPLQAAFDSSPDWRERYRSLVESADVIELAMSAPDDRAI